MASEKPLRKAIYRQDLTNLAPIYQKDGRYIPNPLLIKTTMYHFTFDEANQDSVVNLTPLAQLSGTLTNDKSGVLDIRRIRANATSTDLLLNIFDTQYSRDLSNRPLHFETLFGTAANLENWLPAPLIISPTQTLRIDLTDRSNNNNAVRVNFPGRKYYFDSEDMVYDNLSIATRMSRPYFYTPETNVVLPAATGTNSYFFTIVNEADFYLTRISTRQDNPFLIRLTNRAVGRMFTNGWIHSDNFGTNPTLSLKFEPMLLQRRTQIQLEIQNLVPGSTNTVFITFHGIHYYYER
jgi:hypothetical protein